MAQKLITIVTVALALLAGGCGEDEQTSDYVERLNAIQGDLVAQISDLAGDVPSSQDEAADAAREIAAIFARFADEFSAVEPPQDVADLHLQAVEQIREIAAQTRRTERTLRTGTPEEAQEALRKLQMAATDAQNRLDMLIDEINADLDG